MKEMNEGLLENDILNEILKNPNNKSSIIEKAYIETLCKKTILSGKELMLLPEMENNYLIENLLWQGDVAILLAKEKVGKSILGVQMACALTCGESLLGEYDVMGSKKVLYIQAESNRYDFIDRLKRMTSVKGFRWNPDNFYHMFPPALALDTEEGYDDVLSNIIERELAPDVIFIDPLYMSMQGDLIDNRASRRFCRNVRILQDKFKATIVIVHHENRGVKDKEGKSVEQGDNSVFGSFVWKAFASHVIRMKKLEDGSRTLSCETQRGGNIVKNMKLELVEPDPLMFNVQGTGHCTKSIEQVFKYIEQCGSEGTISTEVMNDTGLSESVVRKGFRYWMDAGKIYKSNPGKCPIRYKTKENV